MALIWHWRCYSYIDHSYIDPIHSLTSTHHKSCVDNAFILAIKVPDFKMQKWMIINHRTSDGRPGFSSHWALCPLMSGIQSSSDSQTHDYVTRHRHSTDATAAGVSLVGLKTAPTFSNPLMQKILAYLLKMPIHTCVFVTSGSKVIRRNSLDVFPNPSMNEFLFRFGFSFRSLPEWTFHTADW